VDFFYSSGDPDMPYAGEIAKLAASHGLIRVHLFDSSQGHLTAERIMADTGDLVTPPGQVSVFLCGPPGMIRAMRSGFRRLGVPGLHIYYEHFDWR
jgi:predicted ferric reductase